MKNSLRLILLCLISATATLYADVSVPSIFGNHMVLQREQSNPVWGWASPGERVTVTINGQNHRAKADKKGDWKVTLDALPVGGPYTLDIKGDNSLSFSDVLSGEVWICSGQSNMAFSVSRGYDGDLEALGANNSNIRIITVPPVGTQEPQRDFKGAWEHCTPESIKDFSAVGYLFGRQLQRTLDVPIGLIDNAWGGSAAEAWVRRDLLSSNPLFKPLLEHWEKTAATYNPAAETEKYEQLLANWESSGKKGARPRAPRNPLKGQHRPANLYNGVLNPTIGYGIRGAIWYQGEANGTRGHQYQTLFPLMIQNWRDDWGQGDFPFYFVQLADFRDEVSKPGDSDWAELREAQTMTLKALPNTGQAVIIDLGEARDIHPRKKQRVASRLVRWALAKDYGYDIAYQSPTCKSHSIDGNKVTIKFDAVGPGLRTFDVKDVSGFAIAGKDKTFVWAQATIVDKDTIEVWSDEIESPASVRYAWAENPVCNLISFDGLPATPFRTDDWPLTSEGVATR